MIEVNFYETLQPSSQWYNDHIWVALDKSVPDYRTWLAGYGGELYVERERTPSGWWVRFDNDSNYTAFLLRFC